MKREDFLKPQELKSKEVTIRDFGTFTVNELSDSADMQFQMWLRPDGKLDKSRVPIRDYKLAQLCISNGDGKPLLEDDDLEVLMSYPPRIKKVILYEVQLINDWIDPVEDDNEENPLPGKSDS